MVSASYITTMLAEKYTDGDLVINRAIEDKDYARTQGVLVFQPGKVSIRGFDIKSAKLVWAYCNSNRTFSYNLKGREAFDWERNTNDYKCMDSAWTCYLG